MQNYRLRTCSNLNGYLDVEFVFVQAGRSPHFDSGNLGKLGYRRERLFWRRKEIPSMPIVTPVTSGTRTFLSNINHDIEFFA